MTHHLGRSGEGRVRVLYWRVKPLKVGYPDVRSEAFDGEYASENSHLQILKSTYA